MAFLKRTLHRKSVTFKKMYMRVKCILDMKHCKLDNGCFAAVSCSSMFQCIYQQCWSSVLVLCWPLRRRRVTELHLWQHHWATSVPQWILMRFPCSMLCRPSTPTNTRVSVFFVSSNKWVRDPLCEEFSVCFVVPPSSGSSVSLQIGQGTAI